MKGPFKKALIARGSVVLSLFTDNSMTANEVPFVSSRAISGATAFSHIIYMMNVISLNRMLKLFSLSAMSLEFKLIRLMD